MALNLVVELERRKIKTRSRLERLRLLELCTIYNNARLHVRSISFHAGINYQNNLIKKYLDKGGK